MQVEALLAAIDPALPCGPDLEYDPAFMALEQAARGKPEQQFGETVVPAEEPDWIEVRQGAEALLARTKDLRVAVLLTRALIKTAHMPGLTAGLTLLHELLARYWDSVHPMLDVEDDNDPTMRINTLAQLVDPDTVLRDVRVMYLVAPGRHGRLSLRDVLVHLGKFPAPANETVYSQSQLEGILRASEADNQAALQALQASLGVLSALRTTLVEKVDAGRVPDLRPLEDMLGSVARFVQAALGTEASGGDDQAAEEGAAQGQETSAKKSTGELRTREDALRALDRVCEFIERSEPSSPAPLLIRRAQRLMTMSFIEIIEDMASDGSSQVRTIAGVKE